MVDVFGNDIKNAFTGGQSVKAIYSFGVKVWPTEKQYVWIEKDWGELAPARGDNVWKDNDGHIYSSDPSTQLELVDGVWIQKDWSGSLMPNRGFYIWKDNDGHIYHSYKNYQYELVDGVWVNKYWNGTKTLEGCDVWKDNDEHIYNSYVGVQQELVNGLLVDKDWGDRFPRYGRNVWHDNDGHIYNSDNTRQYELVNGLWINKNWGDSKPKNGYDIWYDNDGHIYYSKYVVESYFDTFLNQLVSNSYSLQYELVDGVWINKDWSDFKPEDGSNVWHDNDGHIYYSSGNDQYELIPIDELA